MLNEDSWICKDNKLINATYKLSIGEQKLILAISSMVNPFDEEFKDYTISIRDFAKLLDVDLTTNKNFYSRIKRASSLLLSKRLTIHEDDGDFQTVWLSGIKYYDNEGKVDVSFHPKLKKYYLQLQKYTKYRLRNITNLNSEYSLKIYEALKQHEKVKERLYNLEDLKRFLGVENQYDRFYDFKKRILIPTQKELNEKTDISFNFKEIKEGRSIKHIKFYIKANEINEECCITSDDEKNIKSEEDLNIEKIKSIMNEYNITSLEAKKIFDSSKGDLKKIVEVYNHFKNKKLDNIVGTMISMVRPGEFQAPKQNNPKSSEGQFNNYDQRTYDFEDLEKRLLGWDNNE